jgi:hypothetical protein
MYIAESGCSQEMNPLMYGATCTCTKQLTFACAEQAFVNGGEVDNSSRELSEALGIKVCCRDLDWAHVEMGQEHCQRHHVTLVCNSISV